MESDRTMKGNHNESGQKEENTATEESKILKLLTTVLLYLSYAGLGMADGLIAVTFLDLRDQLDVDTATMSFTFTTRFAGVALGSMSAGYLTNIKTLNKTLLLGIYLIVSSVLFIVTPWLQHVALVMLLIGLSGISTGSADTVHNVLVILTWGQQSGPYLQGLHFSFTVGAFIAPGIAMPFISKQIHSADNNGADVFADPTETLRNYTILDTSVPTVSESNHTVNDNVTTMVTTMTKSRIVFAYLIIGLYVGILGVCFCILVRFNKQRVYQPANEVREQDEENDTDESQDTLPRYYKIKFLILLGMIFFAYGSLQALLGGLLIPFVVQGLDWTKQQGTLIVSAFWITFAISRLVTIPIFATKFIRVTQLILINISMIFISSIIFVIFVQFHFIVVWITMLVIGIGQATLLVAAMLWYRENVMPMTTGLIPSIQISSHCLGAISVPLLTGYLIDKVQAMCFPYVIVTLTTLMTSLSCFTYVSVRLYKKRHKQTEIATEVEMKPMM